MLGLLLPLAAPAQVRHAAWFDHGLFSACEGGSYPKGLLIDLNKERSDGGATVNNLGGYKGVDAGACAPISAETFTPGECGSCGCGCPDCGPPSSDPKEMVLGRVVHVFDGSGLSPSQELDLVITNMTTYMPWTSAANRAVGTFGEISVAANTETKFRFSFRDPDTGEEVAVEAGYEFCYMDFDTGPQPNNLNEEMRLCGFDNYFSHGKLPTYSTTKDYLCENIPTADYIRFTEESNGCLTAVALKEGKGSDNPKTWSDILMNLDSSGDGDGRFATEILLGSSGLTCADYDKCPASGQSGYKRKLIADDIIECTPGTTHPQAGVYPNGQGPSGVIGEDPLRYTLPKFFCAQYPGGTSGFEVTYKVGPSDSGMFGRNFVFGGTGAPSSCELACESTGSPEKVIFVIIHGAIGNEFWNTWYEGAYNALPPNTAAKLVYLRTGYSIPATANYLDRACSEADGVIISVPYADEASRRSIADRINSCLEQKPDKPYLLTNTDTAYDMTEYFSSGSRLSATFDGYIGSANYDMGTTCAILAVTKSMDSAMSGVLPTADAVDSSMKIAVYWSENEQDNAGIEQRKEGIYQAVKQIGGMDLVKVGTTVSEIRPLSLSGHYVIALGTGAASELQQAGVSVDLQCGDDVDRGQLSFYGQSTYTQGLQAAGQMYAYLIRPTDGFGEEGSPSANLLPGAPQQTVGVVGVDSGEYEVVSPPYEPAFQQPSCPLKLAVITHAPTTDDIPPSPRKDADTFWEIWYVGSEDSKQDFDMT